MLIVSCSLVVEWSDSVATIGGLDMASIACYPSIPFDKIDTFEQMLTSKIASYVKEASTCQSNHGVVALSRRGHVIWLAPFSALAREDEVEPQLLKAACDLCESKGVVTEVDITSEVEEARSLGREMGLHAREVYLKLYHCFADITCDLA